MGTELLATFIAGIGCAGVALWFRVMTRKGVPRWTIPMMAGAGMLAYQVFSEYTWYERQLSALSEQVVIVRQVEQTSWWRPWSWFAPQTFRFVAANLDSVQTNALNAEIVKVDLYLVERHQRTTRVSSAVHCGLLARADYNSSLQIPAADAELSSDWYALDQDDLLLSVCP